MTHIQVMRTIAMLAFSGTLAAGAAWGADQNQPSAFGRAGNKGEGFTDEQIIKGKGQTPRSSVAQDAQVNMGGARPVLEGKVIDIQGEDYLIHDSSGTSVHVRVNKDTSTDCAGAGSQGTTISSGQAGVNEQQEIAPTHHMQEQNKQQQASEQPGPHRSQARERHGDQSGTQSTSAMGPDSGGDIARGSGFALGPKGGCKFKVGDHIRAQVSDLGTVLYLKHLSDQDMRPQQAHSGQTISREGQMMPGEQASAQQRAQLLKPGSVPAPTDLQQPESTTATHPMAKVETQQKNNCEGCHLIRGLVLHSEANYLLVKDTDQKEVRLKMDQHTKIGQVSHPEAATFVEGDRIEAYVTKDGRAWSVTTLKQQQSQPGVIGAPGD